MLKKLQKNHIFLTIQGLLIWAGLCAIHCNTGPDVKPIKQLVGYKTDHLFSEAFETDLMHWQPEGTGEIAITPDNRLMLADSTPKGGVAVWADLHLDDNFQFEFDLDLTDSSGLFIIFLCGLGRNGEDIFETGPRSGRLTEYSNGDIRNYQIAFHSIDETGLHHNHTKVRKNPESRLLANVEEDPCKESRRYHIDVIKLSNRIQMYVDGHIVHDVRDKGAFGHAIYLDGKIGFWTRGHKPFSPVFIDNFKVFKLTPI